MSLDGEGGPTLHRVLVCLFFGFFCILLSLLYPLCLCLLSPFLIFLPLIIQSDVENCFYFALLAQ